MPETDEERFDRLSGMRGPAKVTNYSATYNVGVESLSRNGGMTRGEAKDFLKAFWDMNWAIKEISDKATVKKDSAGGLWLYNPVSGFWISLRYERDIFSSLNQSTGVYVFDTWKAYIKSKGLKVAFEYHDEVLLLAVEGREQEVEEVIQWAMGKTNDKIKLNVRIGCESKFGRSYSEVH